MIALEITGESSPKTIAKDIRNNGLAIVRGLFDRTEIEDIYRRTVAKFDEIEAEPSKAKDIGHRNIQKIDFLDDFADLFEYFNGRLHPIFKAYFNAKFATIDQALARRQTSTGGGTAHWHQDAPLCVVEKPMLTVWIPLVECGRNAPGLKFLLKTMDETIRFPGQAFRPLTQSMGDDYYKAFGELSDDDIRGVVPEPQIFTPIFNPGDAAIFNGFVAHGTYILPEMRDTRYSFDMRTVGGRIATDPPRRIPSPSLMERLFS